MNPNPDPLEKKIDSALKSLPARRAPVSLEQRVLAELARREALPWWRRSWTYWPTSVQWAFLIISAALSAAIIAGTFTVFRSNPAESVQSSFSHAVAWLQACGAALKALGSITADLAKRLPAGWLYGIVGGVVFAYALLFGLGATAYRTLWQTR